MNLRKTLCQFFTVALLMFGAKSMAGERLISRFTYFANDPQCMIWPNFAWEHKYIAKNRAVLRYAKDKDFFYRYTPKIKGLPGVAEVFLYKYSCNPKFDNRVLTEVFHGGKMDTIYVDFTSTRDAWVSIGRFRFSGDGRDFVQFSRIKPTDNGEITPVLPIRFDLYYDTQTRQLSKQEMIAALPVGLSTHGSWKSLKKSGYRPKFNTLMSTAKGDVATWNPGQAMAGKLNIYLYRPNVKANDIYRVAHNGKVDVLRLQNLTFANLDLYNPVTAQGWYKLGEFDFAGKGNEFLQVEKGGNDTTLLDCMILERVNLEGTLLDRTVVTPMQFDGKYKAGSQSLSLEEKIKTTKQMVGLWPNNNGHSISTSSRNGSTIYSRALYSSEKSPRFVWNPCITEPGEYTVYYFPYFMPNSGGKFEIVANGTKKEVKVNLKDLVVQQQYPVGRFAFAGGKSDEYVVMSDINRASDVTFEKEKAGGALLQQVVVTAHPYFVEYRYDDTKNLPAGHDLGEMVRRGFVLPVSPSVFGVSKPYTVQEFIRVLKQMLDSADVKYKDQSLLHLVNGTSGLNRAVTLNEAAQLMLNAMELSGRYANVRNYFKSASQTILEKYTGVKAVKNTEAVARMIEMDIIKAKKQPEIVADKVMNRMEAILILKEFNEQILGSGPPARADWEVTFFDEFEGTQINWDKWYADDAVRFNGVSAKWKENCVLEDGLFKGYNFMDNHVVPYSSGNLHTVYRQTYGFFEARYKYPDRAYGSHSSFWANSRGGDFNYNEGAYPNSVSNNNYFMQKGTNFHDFATPTNLAHDFHTISGYLNDKDLFYGMDGKITWEVKNYPQFYSDAKDYYSPFGKTTNSPYNTMISTVVTYFDGPLDRDRIDGSYMACDWVRIYKETTWLPSVEAFTRVSPAEWIIKFNKPMDVQSINRESLKIEGSKVPSYRIERINDMRFRIVFSEPTGEISNYKLKVKSTAKDNRGQSLEKETELRF